MYLDLHDGHVLTQQSGIDERHEAYHHTTTTRTVDSNTKYWRASATGTCSHLGMGQDGGTIVVDVPGYRRQDYSSDSDHNQPNSEQEYSTSSERQDSDDHEICEDSEDLISECSFQSLTSCNDIPVNTDRQDDIFTSRVEQRVWFEAIRNNQAEHHESERETWRALPLSDFRICRASSQQESEERQVESLHVIASEIHNKKLCFYIQGVVGGEVASGVDMLHNAQIVNFSIDQLDCLDSSGAPQATSCRGNVLIQTAESSEFDGWYRLHKPAPTYSSIYTAFTWTADLLKHTMNFVEDCTRRDESVGLRAFEHDFYDCLRSWHGSNLDFQTWHRHCNSTTDFRSHLCSATNAQFITDQVYHSYDPQDHDDRKVLDQPLWQEMGAKAFRESREVDRTFQTIVTEHIGTTFLRTFPEWEKHNLLKTSHLDPDLQRIRNLRRRTLHLPDKYGVDPFSTFVRSGVELVSKTQWHLTRAVSNNRKRPCVAGNLKHRVVIVPSSRYAQTQAYQYAVVMESSGDQIVVRWLVGPQDTICSGLSATPHVDGRQTCYPIGNELFLADAWPCETILKSQIIGLYTASILAETRDDGADFVVNRRYCHRQRAIISASWCDFTLAPKQDPSPARSRVKPEATTSMKNVSLFSGAGILDEQLRTGSENIIQTIFTAEIDSAAILSLKANKARHDNCVHHHNNVNTLLDAILTGEINMPDADMLTAGCPCQGFSNRNTHRSSRSSQRNCTLLAHTISWVEVLLPKVVLIENVRGMDSFQPSAAGQAISCLVALGYQARITTVRASDLGGATIRDRLFIVASIPGIPLPEIPKRTGHNRNEGQTASDVTADLQEITNDTLLNVEQPNHVPYVRLSPIPHSVVKKLRRDRGGSGQTLSSVRHLLRGKEKRWYCTLTREQRRAGSSALCRAQGSQPYRTITCSMNIFDARGVPPIHWSQDRVLSIAELRRFHGLLDSFLLISDKSEQLSQLGNSVAGATGRAWGLSIATAWQQSPYSRVKHERSHGTKSLLMSTKTDDDVLATRLTPSRKEDGTTIGSSSCYNATSLKLDATEPISKRKRVRYIVSDSESDSSIRDKDVRVDHQSTTDIVEITTCHETLDVTPTGSIYVGKRSKTIVRHPSAITFQGSKPTCPSQMQRARCQSHPVRPEIRSDDHPVLSSQDTAAGSVEGFSKDVKILRTGVTVADAIVIEDGEEDGRQ